MSSSAAAAPGSQQTRALAGKLRTLKTADDLTRFFKRSDKSVAKAKAMEENKLATPTSTQTSGATDSNAAAVVAQRKYVSIPQWAAKQIKDINGGAVEMLPLWEKENPPKYSAQFYGIKASEMFEDPIAAKNGERGYVKTAMLRSKRVYFIRRCNASPIIVFENISDTKQWMETFEKRLVVIDRPTVETQVLNVNLGETETRHVRMVASEPHWKVLEAKGPAKLRNKDAITKSEVANDKERKIVQVDVHVTVDEWQECNSVISKHCKEAKEQSTFTVYPYSNIVTSAQKALQVTIRQRYDEKDRKNRFDRAMNALRVAQHLYDLGAMAMPCGTDVRVLVDDIDTKGSLKDYIRATFPGFLPQRQEIQFSEDLPSAWATKAAPSGAAASEVSTQQLMEETASLKSAKKITEGEDVFVVMATRQVEAKVWDGLVSVINMTRLTVKNGRTMLAKGKARAVPDGGKRIELASGLVFFARPLSAEAEVEGPPTA